jgi:hypothetical protein
MVKRMWRRALLLLCLLAFPAGGHASDFWDEVRTPGLRAHATLMHDVALALRRDEGHHALSLLQRDAPTFANQVDTLRMRGLSLALTGDKRGGLALLQRALSADVTALDDVTWGTRAALIGAEVGALAWSTDVLSRVIATLPAIPVRRELFALLGDLLLGQGPARLNEALIAYREALRGATTTDTRGTLGLALALSRNGEASAAKDVVERLSAASRIDVVVNALPVTEGEKAARLALGAEALGDWEGAVAQWKLAAADPIWQAHANLEAQRIEAAQKTPRARTRKP